MSPLLAPLIVSAGLGALIGLIRQWGTPAANGSPVPSTSPTPASPPVTTTTPPPDFGGVRTHTFWALLGCLGTYVSHAFSPLALPVVILALSAHLIALHWAHRHDLPSAPGNTSFAAALLTVFTGVLVALDQTEGAILVAALTMVMLGLKQTIHGWTRRFTDSDLRATLQFVAITGVILPLVPNRAYGPYDAFNPYTTWMLVILISGLGFAGYVAMRLLGARAGLLVTSLLGGLASSTASTLAFSRSSKTNPAWSADYAFAVVAACTVMLPRVLLVVAVLSAPLALKLAPAFAAMTLPALAYGAWLWFRRRGETTSAVAAPALANPLSLATAIKFALLYALIAFLVKAAAQLDLQAGLLPLSFISGLTDVDAIALSVANGHAGGSLALPLAAKATLVGVAANSFLKITLAVTLGAPALRRPVALVLGLTAFIGLAAAFFA